MSIRTDDDKRNVRVWYPIPFGHSGAIRSTGLVRSRTSSTSTNHSPRLPAHRPYRQYLFMAKALYDLPLHVGAYDVACTSTFLYWEICNISKNSHVCSPSGVDNWFIEQIQWSSYHVHWVRVLEKTQNVNYNAKSTILGQDQTSTLGWNGWEMKTSGTSTIAVFSLRPSSDNSG